MSNPDIVSNSKDQDGRRSDEPSSLGGFGPAAREPSSAQPTSLRARGTAEAQAKRVNSCQKIARPDSVLDLLREAYGFLAPKARFTAEAMCVDIVGNPVNPEDPRAYAFDAPGALWYFVRGGSRAAIGLRNDALQALNEAARERGYRDLFHAQRHGHAATLDVIAQAGRTVAVSSDEIAA